ncbi:Six-hairpin glycosidase-like protein [Blyttiomyces helicus]|uniref:glucan 1,4-alpha-glucosidase n=1 Tax=Blyttiomyces helicus TaxID=388810 RepID=A0A4P9W092_9FUNG|nr:Six-hairpin glycosidase-like protein [Blyttiomyces helicus]|eukprot:RKO84735.1 Six-hairpin glycosidase-like protein [Blyttiomyces helicus]
MTLRRPRLATRGAPFLLLLLCLIGLSFSLSVSKTHVSQPLPVDNGTDHELERWLEREVAVAWERLLANIHPDGTAVGVVVASPSREHPNYWYTWTRDSALTMRVIAIAYGDAAPGSAEEGKFSGLLWDYAAFSRRNQERPNLSGDEDSGGLGEPKFYVDGTPYNEPWGRPQNDGPALRALTLMHFATTYLDRTSDLAKVATHLYAPALPARTVIKSDLEHIARTWGSDSVELWEEVRARSHFHTLQVQAAALQVGAEFAVRMGDPDAGVYYAACAARVADAARRHFDMKRGWVVQSLGIVGDDKGKKDGLDVAVMLAALQVPPHTRIFALHGVEVVGTAVELMKRMAGAYNINKVVRTPNGFPIAPGIGRYVEDIYDGYDQTLGNPWVLATAAYAELAYTISTPPPPPPPPESHTPSPLPLATHRNHTSPLHQSLREVGDAFLRRVMRHANADGTLSEQMNRESGFMQGARELTWSYAGFLLAVRARGKGWGVGGGEEGGGGAEGGQLVMGARPAA